MRQPKPQNCTIFTGTKQYNGKNNRNIFRIKKVEILPFFSSHADASLLYTFASAESAMRKARRKQLPPIPNTINELGDVLSKSNLFRIHSGPNKDKFYQTALTVGDTTCLIFLHRKTLQLIGRIDEMHVDVSFDIKPSTQSQYYLLIAHCVQIYTVCIGICL